MIGTTYKEKGLVWLTVLEVSIHNCLTLLLLDCDMTVIITRAYNREKTPTS
jgi:hypothetical protein